MLFGCSDCLFPSFLISAQDKKAHFKRICWFSSHVFLSLHPHSSLKILRPKEKSRHLKGALGPWRLPIPSSASQV